MLKEYIFNEKEIKDKELIKEIEEKGQLMYSQRGEMVCIVTIDRYYYYNNNIIRVERTDPPKKEDVEKLEEDYLRGKKIVRIDNPQGHDPQKLEKMLSEDLIRSLKSNVGESKVWKCVQANLLSVNVEVFTSLVKCNLFEKDLKKKKELVKKIKERIEKEDVENGTISCELSMRSCVNGTNMSMHMNKVKIEGERKFLFVKGEKTNFSISIEDDNLGIAHQVIDEYREVYKLHLCKDKENYMDITILFINTDKKSLLFGAIR